jgi:hypothetical protein
MAMVFTGLAVVVAPIGVQTTAVAASVSGKHRASQADRQIVQVFTGFPVTTDRPESQQVVHDLPLFTAAWARNAEPV